MLAVVEEQQHSPAGQGLGDGVEERHVALRRDAHHRGDRRRYGGAVPDGGQLDDPYAVRELARQLGAHLEGQPSLPDSADTAHRHQPIRSDQLGYVGDQLFAPDERAELLWQVAHEVVDAAQDGELARQAVGDDLEHRDPSSEAAHNVLAEGSQRQPAAQHRRRRVRHEDLPTVAERHQTRRAVDLAAEVVAVAFDRLASVERPCGR